MSSKSEEDQKEEARARSGFSSEKPDIRKMASQTPAEALKALKEALA